MVTFWSSWKATAVIKTLKLAIAFLTIPLISFFSLGSALGDRELVWEQTTQKQILGDRVPASSLQATCADPSLRKTFNLEPVCQPFENIGRIVGLAAFTGLVAVLFASLVWVAGAISKKDRKILLRVFRPGLVVSNVVVALLLLLQAALLSGTILYSFLNGDANENFYFYTVFFGAAALVGGVLTVKPLFGNAQNAHAVVLGIRVAPAEYPVLWAFVKHIAAQVGTDAPHNLIVGLTPAFYVTQTDVTCIGGRQTGRSMYISLPLCRILTVAELTSVIAHELGHFKGEDTAFSVEFYPIYQGGIQSLRGVSQVAARINKFTQRIPLTAFRLLGVAGSLTLLPSILMLGYFLERFAAAERALSREREIAADETAARIAGSATIASALVKLHAFIGTWELFTWLMSQRLLNTTRKLGDEQRYAAMATVNASLAYAKMVAERAGPKSLDELDMTALPHPTATHPPLSTRLKALGKTLAEIQHDALNVAPDPSSVAVIDDCMRLEVQLTLVQAKVLRMQGAK